MTCPVACLCDHLDVTKWRGRLTGRCTGNNNVITVWAEAYCTDAASTNSTTKQRTVVDLAMAEHLLELRAVPFDARATWADIATVHDAAFARSSCSIRPAWTRSRVTVRAGSMASTRPSSLSATALSSNRSGREASRSSSTWRAATCGAFPSASRQHDPHHGVRCVRLLRLLTAERPALAAIRSICAILPFVPL